MSIYICKLIIKYFHFIPNSILEVLVSSKKNTLVPSNFYNIDEWQLTYKGSNLVQFFIPLILDIFILSSKIFKVFKAKKLISIITILVIYEEKANVIYTHSLFESNKLYSRDNFKNWSISLLYGLVEKLELYNSFKKISLIIKVKEITII